jgi:hypothetical protein
VACNLDEDTTMIRHSRPLAVKSGLLIALLLTTLLATPSLVSAQFADKISTTPAFLQDGFGPAGDYLRFGGQAYCVPTSAAMLLGYLGNNGFSQIAPSDPTPDEALNLVRVLAGLMGTDALRGTGQTSAITSGLQTYLAAKGIGANDYSLTVVQAPSISALATLNQNQTVVELLCGYYKQQQSDGPYQRGGGHGVALLAQGVDASGQPAANTLAINNPLPSAFASVADLPGNALQYFNTVASPVAVGALELDRSQDPEHWGDVHCVIETAIALTVNERQLSVNNPTPAPWTLSSGQAINLQNGYLSVLAPLVGSGGIALSDGGVLDLKAADTTSGMNVVAGSTLRSSITSGLPFGSGAMSLQGGRLELIPASGAADISLTVASGAGKYLTFACGAELAIDRNGNNSLKVTIGGKTGGSGLNLLRDTTLPGTLVIAPAGGIAALGASEQVLVAGSGTNLPTLINGIVAPYIVAKDNDVYRSGDFLTYGASGFVKAAYTLASATPIASAGSNAVVEADVDQTIPGGTITRVSALKVDRASVGGGSNSSLMIGTVPYAGLILNGGAINTSSLMFSGEALIYTSQAGGTISSSLMASSGLTTFGPGALTLTGANPSATAIHVNSGTLVAASTSGPTLGNANVTVEQGATLKVTGKSGGSTNLKYGATLLLDGGTLTGSLAMASGSYLLGHGTIDVMATLSGVIGGSATDPAAAGYSGVEHITFTRGISALLTTYSWRLGALDDTPSNAGTNWSLLDFLGGGILGTPNTPFFMSLDFGPDVADPNSGNVFWNQSHQWLVADTPNRFSNVAMMSPFPAFSQGRFSSAVDAASRNVYISYTPVPEPGTLAMLVLGMLAVLVLRRQ